MSKHSTFENNPSAYDQWYVDHPFEYQSELEALRQILGDFEHGLEIGVGTGRFAGPLNISTGLDPSPKMLDIARVKGIEAIQGVAENLPFKDNEFDLVLFVTTVCFLSDVEKAFQEANRVLKAKGRMVIGFVDKNSSLGGLYEAKKEASIFYKEANFHGVDEMIEKLKKAGFPAVLSWQTLFNDNPTRVEPCIQGHGRGNFIILKANKE